MLLSALLLLLARCVVSRTRATITKRRKKQLKEQQEFVQTVVKAKKVNGRKDELQGGTK